MDSRRHIGGFAVLSLVLLRLAVGWHFFSEGLEKIDYDSSAGRFRVTFSAAGFLAQAKGPLADKFRALAPDGHDWRQLLAEPHLATAAEAARVPYKAWVARVAGDWRGVLDQVKSVPGLTNEQLRQAEAALTTRIAELNAYLAGESAAIAEYQHELWRLSQMQSAPEAEGAPFQQERMAAKAAETTAAAQQWLAGVEQLEQNLLADFRGLLTPEQRASDSMPTAMERAITSPQERQLNRINVAVTALTLAVGTCLLLGLFTRLASLAGALFLVSIIATQPPWIPEAEPTIYQTVELAGLLVLAGTGAGRWLGLDFFTWALFHRHEDSMSEAR